MGHTVSRLRRTVHVLGLLVVTAALMGAPCPAHAALRAPPRAGVALAGGWADDAQLRLAAHADASLVHGLGVRLLAGPNLAGRQVQGRLLAGPTWSLDALTWVPRAVALAGLELPHARATVQAGMELGRFVSLHTGVFVGGYGLWRHGRGFGGLVSVGVETEF